MNRGTVHLSLKAATVTASLIGATAFAIAPAGASPAQATTKTASAAAFSCHVYNTSGSELNVRSGAGTTYSVIGTIAAKGKLPCGSLGEGSVNRQRYKACGITSTEWMTVRINGHDGWVAVTCVALGV
ncbi:SH3 domain-containing protein [Streptomyces diastatochromogenes]|uniref:SH3 domain-containing protein n=1 Tax=Streptomyces diastatochromogenes TaxID=42236 RepID=UPI00117E0F2F|nr:SH3 domain-containing protein [Streptomyces diastatochromogenes]